MMGIDVIKPYVEIKFWFSWSEPGAPEISCCGGGTAPYTLLEETLEAPNSTLIVSIRFSAKRFASSMLFGLLPDNNRCSGSCASSPC